MPRYGKEGGESQVRVLPSVKLVPQMVEAHVAEVVGSSPARETDRAGRELAAEGARTNAALSIGGIADRAHQITDIARRL